MHSTAQTADLTCPQCGRAFAAEIWLIVDAGERPDLLARARAGDLHAVTCPTCGPQGMLDAPLLIYQPNHDPATGQPPLIFSPAQQTSAEQDQQQAAGLLSTLARRLGDVWQDAWLAQVATAPRALLPAALSDDPVATLRELQSALTQGRGDAEGEEMGGQSEEETGEEEELPAALAAALRSIAERLAAEGVAIDSPEALEQALAARPDLQSRLEAALREVAPASDLPGSSAASWKVPDDKSTSLPDLLNRFLDAETWDESQRLVEAYPELLSDEADALFAAALDENAANPDAMQLLTTHRDLLRRCRDAGIARAFAEQMLGADGLAAAARQGLAPEAFLAQMRAAQPQMPPALREVLAALAAEGVEIHSQEDLDAALASRPALRARLAQAMAEQSGSSVPPEFAGDLRAAQAGEQRYQRIGDLTALDAAAAAWARILDAPGFMTADTRFRLATFNNAGGVFLRRHWARGRMDDLNRALRLWEEAVAATPAGSPDLPMYLNNLGAGLRTRFGRTGRLEELEEAIKVSQAAVAATPAGSPDLPGYLNNLGTGLRTRFGRTGRLEELEEAIKVYQAAVAATPAGSPDLPSRLNNLGNGLSTRFGRTGRMEDLEEAIRRYRHACGLGAIVAPQETLNASRNWGRWALRRASWPEVEEAYSQGLAAGRALQRRQLRRTDKESYLADMQEMAPAAAYAIARAGGSPARAAHTLELGRALLLGEALQLNRRDLDSLPAALKVAYDRALAERRHLEAPDVIVAGNRLAAIEAADREFDAVIETIRTAEGFTDFLADPTFAQIQSAAQDGPLVYLLASEAGGLALIVPGGAADQEQKPSFSEKLGFSAGAVEAVWLDGLTEAQLRAWLMGPADDPALGGWLGAYQAWLNERTPAAKTHWYDVMETTLRQAWDAALGPVVAALARYGVPAESMVTLIPSGLLALLPLHAAWTEDPAARPAGVAGCAATGRTYVLDCFAVAYAPSATALRHAQGVAAQAGAGALLAVDEPQPVAAGDLPNSAAEVAAIAELFAGPPPQMLRHSTATRAATLAALPGAQVAHFSCHGGTNWQDALQSGLLLANNELLTVGELLDQRLPGARLITLSACETGIVGTQLPDESVALPAALMQAGFAGVAASLWSVYDISTAMLMVRFYELWRKEGLAPPAALCAAQRWVRDTSNVEKAEHFGRDFLPAGEKMSAAVAAPFFEEVFKRGSGEERTFAHPIWWAAFTYTGV